MQALIHRLLILVGVMCFISLGAYAQEEPKDSTKTEGLELGVEQSVELEITLDSVERLYSQKLIRESKPVAKTEQEYFVNAYELQVTPLQPKIKIYTIKPESKPKGYPSLVKLGYGNYNSPLANIYLNSKEGKDFSWSAYYLHKSSSRGPVDKKNSAYATNDLLLNGAYKKGNLNLSLDLGGELDTYHYYGYPEGLLVTPDKGEIKQQYQSYFAKAGLYNISDDALLKYNVDLGVRASQDDFEASETSIFLESNEKFDLDSNTAILLDFNADLMKYENSSLKQDRNFITAHPQYSHITEGLRYKIGLRLDYENDTLNGSKDLHFYPTAELGYYFADMEMLLYGGFGGGMEKLSYYDSYQQNPYLDSNVYLNHANRKIDLYLGFDKKIIEALHVLAQINYMDYENMSFFVNSGTLQDRFSYIYSKNTRLIKFAVEGAYSSKNRLTSGLRVEFNAYSVDFDGLLEDKPYHRPTAITKLYGRYKVSKRVNIGADFYYIGGIKAFDSVTNEVVTLDGIPDLSLVGRYAFNRKAGLFLEINNVFGKKYERYYRYQNQGVNFIGGFTYAF